jgi:gas vesicle protein
MKPAWDKLMKEFKDSKTALVADVDCTSEGKPLCDANGVQGFPTIKYGDPSALEKYEGGRDYDSLKKFADENLKPMCSPANMDLCDDDQKAELNKLLEMELDDLKSKIEEGEQKIEEAEETFKTELQKLQDAYQKLTKDKEDTIASVKSSGLGQMKSVLAHRNNASDDDKDEL